MLSPCIDCDSREICCHVNCPDYKKFKKELDKTNLEIKKKKLKDKIFLDYRRDKG